MPAIALLIAVAALNLVPVIVAVAPNTAGTLYALDPAALADPITRALLRHRAVLFGLVSLWLVAGAFIPAHRNLAIVSALLARLTFLAVCAAEPAARAPLSRVIVADVVAIVCLLAAAALSRR